MTSVDQEFSDIGAWNPSCPNVRENTSAKGIRERTQCLGRIRRHNVRDTCALKSLLKQGFAVSDSSRGLDYVEVERLLRLSTGLSQPKVSDTTDFGKMTKLLLAFFTCLLSRL